MNSQMLDYKYEDWIFRKKIKIPKDWELKKIKDIAKVLVGLVIEPSTYFDDNGTVPMITGKNVTVDGIILDKVDFITEKNNDLLHKTRIWYDDLVTMRVGYPGRTALVKSEHDGINCASVIITRKSKKFISNFLYYLLNSELISQQVVMHQTGSAQKVINIGSWKNFLIPMPSLPEQEKIASILLHIDELLHKQKQVIQQTQKLMKGQQQNLLFQGIGHGKDLQEVKLNNLSQTKSVSIPTDWSVKKIKDFTNIDPETINENKFGSTDIEYVDIGSITDYRIKSTQTIPVKERPSRAQKILRKNDVIISTVRPYLKSFGIIENEVENLVGSTGFAVIRAINNVDSRWIFYFSQTFHFLTYLTRLMQGSNYPAVSSSTVENTLIPYPNNPKEQEKIVSILSNLDSLIQQEKQYKEKLEKIKRGLMQQLLTGQTRVKV
tara:strand:- start:461 stop:1768 length:1308 start_codon:yes stop_codon:yes gene_type:complete